MEWGKRLAKQEPIASKELSEAVSQKAEELEALLYRQRTEELIAEGIAKNLLTTLNDVQVFVNYDSQWDIYKISASAPFQGGKVKASTVMTQESVLRKTEDVQSWNGHLKDFARALADDLTLQVDAFEAKPQHIDRGGWLEVATHTSAPRSRMQKKVAKAAKRMPELGPQIEAGEEQAAIDSIKQTWKRLAD